jgi:hypothetical protein
LYLRLIPIGIFAQLLGALSVFLLSDYVTTPVSLHIEIILNAVDCSESAAMAAPGRSHGIDVKYRIYGNALSCHLFTAESCMAPSILFHYRDAQRWLGVENCWLFHSHFIC